MKAIYKDDLKMLIDFHFEENKWITDADIMALIDYYGSKLGFSADRPGKFIREEHNKLIDHVEREMRKKEKAE